MYNPVSTIRLQFNKDFTFNRLEELIPFFAGLGINTIYASPIFKATPGSLHGYDIVDPLRINPEIGTENDLIRVAQKLAAEGIGWIQDIVPNHMAFHEDNLWLKDVREKRESSQYAEYFDTQFSSDFFTTPITDSDIIYRRFFLIDGLICVNMHSRKVFEEYHQLIFKLISNGTFKGLRVDHIDGLYDPEEYLRRLRDVVGPEPYIVVEKILEPEEELERWWPIQGTTGYEFIAALNGLFTSRSAKPVFDKIYQSVAPSTKTFDDMVVENKRMILSKYMSGELDNLTQYFISLGLGNSDGLRGAIAEVMIRCPNYRFYDYKRYHTELVELIDDCRTKAPLFNSGYDQLEQAFVEKPTVNAIKFYKRLMQFTGPLMAKGIEDTLMYRFNKFIGLNEVGDLPDEFGSSISTFHEVMTKRLRLWPYSMNATATHDTKRGEDSRARLHVLTDIPNEWAGQVRKWRELNISHGIDPNDEYLVYQALIATYEGDSTEEYLERFLAYASKALREAKVHSRWEDPDEKYESAIADLIRKIVSENTESFLPFFEKVRKHGINNSLVQVLLKITCPGVPDIYQGSITWDFSFVDPDNRRPVDYDRLDTSNDIKVQLTRKLLHIRTAHKNIFTLGRYQPLKVSGNLRSNILAFGREYQGSWMIAAALIHTAQLADTRWDDTVIRLPDDCPIDAQELIAGNKFQHSGELSASELFKDSPVALVFLKQPQRARRSGILMPVASLPSYFPIGDIGYSARQFADFLFESRQRIWQMLPVNAVDRARHFSPYSPISSIAGNTMLISLEDLVYDGFLTEEDIYSGKRWNKNVIDYDAAEKRKDQLLWKAFKNFNERKPQFLNDEFSKFIKDESSWLDAFVEFTRKDGGFTRWTQFIFFRQMKSLRKYCNECDILLLGDVPFYVGSNSVDATQYKSVFATEMAGVPPDYFNDEGQFWGMPVFNWSSEKEQVYSWWIQRLRKNLELYDLVRLDHFRAFSSYWAIPAGSTTGINGEWLKGPGVDFFNALKKELGDLYLVAEDLGDVDKDVYELRDELGLPGMKVIQFGFGGDFPSSPHLPHNHNERSIVYPGTHDNNTTRGWFERDARSAEVKNLELYFNTRVTKRNVHELLTRVAFASHSQTAIVAMQDVLGLDHRSRTNTPSTESSDNWKWKLKDVPTGKVVNMLRSLVHTYER